jgi:hypothetical protein
MFLFTIPFKLIFDSMSHGGSPLSLILTSDLRVPLFLIYPLLFIMHNIHFNNFFLS